MKLAAYRIARYPVTVGEYQRFIEAEGYANKAYWQGGGFGKWPAPANWEEQQEHPTRPVVGVSWYEAAAYAKWANCRLASEAQWERAARGTDGRRWPWGDAQPDNRLLNFGGNVGRPTPVGVYPCGASPEEVLDMAGNVWEWCNDWYGAYSAGEVVDPHGPDNGSARVLRGGSWSYYPRLCRAGYRGSHEPDGRDGNIGFRVALDFP